MICRRLLSLTVVLIVPAIALADTYIPWCDQLVVSSNGKYYVVMNRIGGPKVYGEWGPVEYIICERAADTPPIKSAKSKVIELGKDTFGLDSDSHLYDLYEIKANPKVSVQDRDKILGSGRLQRPPREILVSDAGLGFAGLDVYGYNTPYRDEGLKTGSAVILVSSSGKVIHKKRLTDLFTRDDWEHFDHSASTLWWLDADCPGWINDEAKQLVVIGAASESRPNHHWVRFINWQTGKVTKGPTQSSQKGIKKLKRTNQNCQR